MYLLMIELSKDTVFVQCSEVQEALEKLANYERFLKVHDYDLLMDCSSENEEEW